MEFQIDYQQELEATVRREIAFVREEFKILFGRKQIYTDKERQLATHILNHLSKNINEPMCLGYLSKTLQTLEQEYPELF